MLGDSRHSHEFSLSLQSPSLNLLMPSWFTCRCRWQILALFFEAPHSPEAPAFQLLFIQAHGGLICCCEIGASCRMQEFKRKYAANETVGKLLLKTPHFSSAGFNKGLADSYLLCVSKLFSALATDYY